MRNYLNTFDENLKTKPADKIEDDVLFVWLTGITALASVLGVLILIFSFV